MFHLKSARAAKFAASILFGCTAILGHAAIFTGTYAADSRPRELLFITILQSNEKLSGSLISVTPNDKGGTQSTSGELTGTASGEALVLTSRGGLILNGKLQDGKLSLTYPSTSGQINIIILNPSTEQHFNEMLSRWQRDLAARHADQNARQTAVQAEQKEIDWLGEEVDNDFKSIRLSGIESDAKSMRAALTGQKSALSQLTRSLDRLKRDASVRPMTCSRAYQTVASDFGQTMASDFNQTLGSALNSFRSTAAQLEARLDNAAKLTFKTEDDVKKFGQAVKASKFSPRRRALTNDDALIIEKYKVTQADVLRLLPNWKAESDAIIKNAKELMSDGKATVIEAKSLVRCK